MTVSYNLGCLIAEYCLIKQSTRYIKSAEQRLRERDDVVAGTAEDDNYAN